MPLNNFVYDACLEFDIPFPDIPVRAVEHFGQCAEDIIVRALLVATAMRKQVDLRSKSYLEIGGNHPFATSATYLLAKTFGMKGVLVEANAAGVPVIAMDLGSCPEVIKDGETGFLVGNVAEAVRSLERISEIDRYACRRRVSQYFSVNTMVEAYERVYATIFDLEAQRL